MAVDDRLLQLVYHGDEVPERHGLAVGDVEDLSGHCWPSGSVEELVGSKHVAMHHVADVRKVRDVAVGGGRCVSEMCQLEIVCTAFSSPLYVRSRSNDKGLDAALCKYNP